jgi:ABC-type lipoprotein release transport system permease subunit
MSQTEFLNVDPPLWVAWNQALASIRVRFLRQSITTIGIGIGVAFFCCVQVVQASQTMQAADADRYHWLIGTSVVMCLAGVTNSMLMSVAERYREIGTIKCLGASDSFVVKVFVLEALLIGAAGSLTGAVIGGGLTALFEKGTSPFDLIRIVLIGTGLGMAMTVAAALAPAMQAAKMPAAAALRVEV